MHLSITDVSTETPTLPAQEEKSHEGLPPGRTPKRWLRPLLIAATAGILFIIIITIVSLLFFRTKPSANSASNPKPVTSANRDLQAENTVRLKGTTEAVRMRSILTPVLSGQYVATLTLTKMIPAGTKVKQGDVLAEFDRQSQIRDAIDKQADYDKFVGQVAEEKGKEDANRAKDETEMKQAEDSLEKARLEKQKVEIMSRIDAEKAEEDLEEAQATLAQLRETFALKRKAAQASIRDLEIQRDRTQQVMKHAQSDAALLEIRSPIEGIVVINTIWKQGQMGEVEEGDQLRPGVPFMQVVDPSLMQVRVAANQEDFLHLHLGQAARVHLDAYPDLTFPGKLEEMAPIGDAGDFSPRLRTFTVIFSIMGQDPKLMPDLSAAVDVNISNENNSPEALR
jgi:multidrug resistance efflux pump